MNLNLTLLGQTIGFIIFVWFCMKYVWPPVINAMRDRQKKIADGLESARRAEQDLARAQEKALDHLQEAKADAAKIIEQANKRASQLIEEAKVKASKEGDRLIVAAKADIEQEVQRAKEKLRNQVAAVALAGAEHILQSSIDKKAHSKLFDQLATEL
jgi:F-type H+-transporting ATPase subunit b